MDAQKKKVVILVALFAVVAGLIYWQMFGPNPERDAYLKNFEQSQQELTARQQAGGPAAAPRRAAPAPAAPRGAPAPASRFQKADVDPVELLARVQDVEFNYDEVRTARDPMAPLVGPMARPLLASATDESDETKTGPSMEERLAVRTMALSGIVWDKENPVAVIDNEVVTQGFTFPNGVVVEKIDEDRVVMRVNESLIPIELKEL